MKRLTCFLLVFVVLSSLCACKNDEIEILEPVNFYYHKAETTFGAEDALIGAYVAESAGYEDLLSLLQAYLQCCNDDRFAHTFPTGTVVKEAYVQGQTAYLTLSADFARLSGIDLTIACACLAKTTLELVDATFVCINASGIPMDGSLNIMLSLNDLILMDFTQPND